MKRNERNGSSAEISNKKDYLQMKKNKRNGSSAERSI